MKLMKIKVNLFELVAERFGLLETIKKHKLMNYLPRAHLIFFIDKKYKITCKISKDDIKEIESTLEEFDDAYQDGVSLIHKLKTVSDLENHNIIFRADILYKYLFNLYYDTEIYDYNGSIEKFIDRLFNSKALYFDVELEYFRTEGDWMVKHMGYRQRITTHVFNKHVFDNLLHDGYFKPIKKKTCRKKVLKIIMNLNNKSNRIGFRKRILEKFIDIDNDVLISQNFSFLESDEFYL